MSTLEYARGAVLAISARMVKRASSFPDIIPA